MGANWTEAARALVAALGEGRIASLADRIVCGSPTNRVAGGCFLERGERIREALDARWYTGPSKTLHMRNLIDGGYSASAFAWGLRDAGLAVAGVHGGCDSDGARDARGLLYWGVLDLVCVLDRRREGDEIDAIVDALWETAGSGTEPVHGCYPIRVALPAEGGAA